MPRRSRARPLRDRLHYLPNGGPHQVGPWRVAALGGTFAPSWYHSPASALPPSRGRRTSAASVKLGKSRDDKRRHFVRDEVVACKALSGIDVFLTHEAPRPFYPAGKRLDAGKTVINEVLTAMRPRLHLFGHHHEFTDSVRQGVRSIGLDIVTKSYLLIDAETFRCERLDTMKPFLEALDERVLVCDGAMGTMLYAKGVFINKSFDALEPHATPIWWRPCTRNTCAPGPTSSKRTRSARTGSSSARSASPTSCTRSTWQGCEIARRAAAGRAYVAGAIGPLGIRIEPWGKTGVDEAREYFREQAQALADGGRGSLRARDLPRSERDRRRHRCGPERIGASDHRPDDDRGRRRHPSMEPRPSVSRRSSRSAAPRSSA